jgi:hypothetical protein
MRVFFEKFDNPQVLIKNSASIKDLNGGQPNIYDKERDNLQTIDRDFENISALLYNNKVSLQTSK